MIRRLRYRGRRGRARYALELAQGTPLLLAEAHALAQAMRYDPALLARATDAKDPLVPFGLPGTAEIEAHNAKLRRQKPRPGPFRDTYPQRLLDAVSG